MRTITYSGEIQKQRGTWGDFPTLVLVQEDNYKIDLLSRLEEAVMNYGKTISVRYWTSKVRQNKDEMQAGVLKELLGFGGELRVAHEINNYGYSEFTPDIQYETFMDVDGHNLYEELGGLAGRFLLLEVDFLNA